MGYFWGMLAGIIGALFFPVIFADTFPSVASDILPLYLFPLLMLVSFAACVAGSYWTKAEDDKILMAFYRRVRPWGYWQPIHDKVVAVDPGFERNKNFKRDMFNVFVGIITQTCLVAAPIYLVIRENSSLVATVVVFIICASILKKTWYDKLDTEAANPNAKPLTGED
jgi:hypothetical protein